jgi:CDP-glucose 4,6-dehydratase
MIKNQTTGEWNFGPTLHEKYSVVNLVNVFAKAWGANNAENAWQIEKLEQPRESGYLLLDSSKARGLLGWTEKLDFDESVALTADWFKKSQSQDPLEVTTCQIKRFLSII